MTNYDQRIELFKPTETRDETGDTLTTYATQGKVWGSYLVKSGREFIAAQKRNSDVSASFEIRYHSTITNEWRIVFRGVTYEILFLDDTLKRDNKLMIDCREVTQ
jgi:SPP1 family predicted phage head-tail adaptor